MSTMKHDMDQNGKIPAPAPGDGMPETPNEKKGKNEKRATKKSLRWTAIDTFILLLVLLGIAGVVVRSFVKLDGKSETEISGGPYYVEFTVQEVHADVLEEFCISDRFYLYETGELVGFLGYYADGERALKAGSPVSDGDGHLVTADGCLYCPEGRMENGGLLLEGVDSYLVPGAVLRLRTDRAVMTVEITRIRTES